MLVVDCQETTKLKMLCLLLSKYLAHLQVVNITQAEKA